MNTNSDILETILARSTQELETWLDEVSIGGAIEGKPFNWQLFAFSMAAQATDERNPRKAHIALRVYEELAGREMDPDAFSLMFSAMNLRAWMIRELGAQKGHVVLDPEPIVNWFLQTATLSLEEVRRLSSVDDLRTVPLEQLRQLRKTKNALNTLALIPDSGILQKHPELKEWLRLRASLP